MLGLITAFLLNLLSLKTIQFVAFQAVAEPMQNPGIRLLEIVWKNLARAFWSSVRVKVSESIRSKSGVNNSVNKELWAKASK